MKKNIVRGLALALVLILALGIIPLGAFAIDPDKVFVDKFSFSTSTPTAGGKESVQYHGEVSYDFGETIKASDYNPNVAVDGELYDFAGFSSVSSNYKSIDKKLEAYENKNYPGDSADPDVLTKYYEDLYAYMDKLLDNSYLTFSKSDIKVDPFPTAPDSTKYDSPEAFAAANKKYEQACKDWYYKYDFIVAGYTPHQHKLSYWYSDDTTHWRECLVCKKYWAEGFWEQFMFQNWHSDGDEDRVCDVCNADIPYHEVTVEETKGGKITVDYEEAPHRRKITANVEPEEGYKLKKLHFIKVRDDGSEQEITRRKTSSKNTWWAYMPTYDLKVTAEFVKK